MTRPCRSFYLVVHALGLGMLALIMAGCPDGGAAGGPWGTTSSGGTTSSTTTGEPDPACVDNQDGNHSAQTAHVLTMENTAIVRVDTEREGVLCGGSDWYRIDPPCNGFLGVEVFVLDESGTVETQVRDTSLDALRSTSGSFALHPSHLPVSAGNYFVEVAHVSGSAVQYELRTYFLPDGTCTSAEYLCEADTGLVATETSCGVVVRPGDPCAMGNIVTDNAPLPGVDDGQSGTVDGFAVYVGAHVVRNVHRPTTSEMTLIEDRCEQACEAYWGDHPHIAATCDDSEAFLTPTLRSTPALPTFALIPSAQQDGSDIFLANQLGCNLHTSCCTMEHFAADLCPTRYDRVTPGPEMIGHGVDRRFALHTTNSAVEVSGSFGTESSAVSGTVGYSHARLPNDTDARPFYLGELQFETSAPIEAELDCTDEDQQMRSIDALEVRLAQPAFGIAKLGTNDVGFPPGALVFEVEMTVDSTPFRALAVNPENVTGTASDTGFSLTDLALPVSVPCGAGTSSVVASIDLSNAAGTPLDRPPSVIFNLSSSVACASNLDLDATVTDPDSDLDTVRWYANGVLLDPSLTEVAIDGLTIFEIRACDERGGCSWAQESATCSSCAGTAVPCSAYTGMPAACTAQPGCTRSLLGCVGTRSCGQFEESDCNAADGCDWVGACADVDEPCTQTGDCCDSLYCSYENVCTIPMFGGDDGA